MSLEVAGTIRQKKIGLSLASRWGWNLPAPARKYLSHRGRQTVGALVVCSMPPEAFGYPFGVDALPRAGRPVRQGLS